MSPATRPLSTAAALVLAGAFSAAAAGASHLWRFNELFSNADGSIQFIELLECCGAQNETRLEDKWIGSDSTGMMYVFPADIPCTNCTANRTLLIATASFAALPGAPTPDYIMPPHLFDTGGDFLRYWLYTKAVMEFGPGELPVDGVRSLCVDGTTGPNTPTNFAGETGSVIAPCHPADFDGTSDVGFGDLLDLLANWGPCAGCRYDLDADGVAGFSDLVTLLSFWGPCE